MRRFAARRDANEPEIVKALQAAGAKVQPLDPGKGGVPDLLVGYHGRTLLLEVKNPARVGGRENKSKTLQKQTDFRKAWTGDPVRVVETVEDALATLTQPQD